MAKTIFKNDKFKSARWGYSRMLQITCSSCENTVAHYQKDGPWDLKRMYLDRIISPPEYNEKRLSDISTISDLHCPRCNKKLWIVNIYEKEHRRAFQLFQWSICKQIIKQ